MTQISPLPLPTSMDPTSYACASFLARYRGDTFRAYSQDMTAFLRWCADRQLPPLAVQRPHLELYIRWMEQRGYAPATIGRRFNTVAGFFRYALIDGHVPADPTIAVTRPKVPWESQARTFLHPLEFAALLTAGRHDEASSHALVALLGMLGLRVGETCRIDVTDIRYYGGYEVLSIIGKGDKPAQIPLPVPVLRAVKAAAADRAAGPLLLTRIGPGRSRLRPRQCRAARTTHRSVHR